MDSQESRSESSDADGWKVGDILMNTDMFFRPSSVSGRRFDGDSAMEYFAARGHSLHGHRLAAGEDEYGPYFRLLEISSGASRRRPLTWGRCFGQARAPVIDLEDDSPTATRPWRSSWSASAYLRRTLDTSFSL